MATNRVITVQGIPVYSPEQAIEKYDESVIALAGRRYEGEMRKQLNLLGISDSRIFVYSGGIDWELLKMK